jgi:putative flippase GtrA
MMALLAKFGLTHERLREVFTYGLATGFAFGVDIGLLTLLVSRLQFHPVLAAALSFTVGGVVLYFLSVRFVFRKRRITNRTLELSYFVGLGVAGLAVQTIVMLVAVDALHVHYLIAKLCAACCTFVANFLLRRTLLFSHAATAKPADGA